MPQKLFDIIDNHALNEDTCFLCGASLDVTNRSEEHVFPEWLLHRFSLWNKTITLLNRTTIPYRQLKIPCCRSCNNNYLSSLENRIASGILTPNGSGTLPSTHDIYLWVAKILIGLMYRELLLPFDRADPISPPIVEPKVMQSFRMMHFFMQSVRLPMQFCGPRTEFPASVFLYDLQCPKAQGADFDFKDNPINQTVFLRLGTKGILAAFDGGAQDQVLGDLFRRDGASPLHPLQFEELGAKLFYKASLLRRIPYFLIGENNGRYIVALLSMDDPLNPSHVGYATIDKNTIVVRAMPPPGADDGPMFDVWDQDAYAQYLSAFTGAPLNQINPTSGKVMSWISNERHEFTPMDLQKEPWRGVH